jgi:hypothetical protein
MDAVLLVALSNAVVKMAVVVDASSVDAAVASSTVTAVLLLEFLASNDASHSSIITTPLFYTTDILSATEIETALLHSGFISTDFFTSMQASLLARNSSNNTAVTVDDATAASTEDASTTTAILTTA